MVTYPLLNITKGIIIFSSQQCHVTDRVTRTRTNCLLEIKEYRASIVFPFFFFLRTSFNYENWHLLLIYLPLPDATFFLIGLTCNYARWLPVYLADIIFT